MNHITENSKEYYDRLWLEMEKSGLNKPNTRHYAILTKLKKFGFKRSDSTIELGCGAGALSILLGKYLRQGTLLAADLSEEVIKVNKYKYINYRNIEFVSKDITTWTPPNKYDSIILPDVIEHIPLELHDKLWEAVGKISTSESKLFINIPHPKALEHFHEFDRESLQSIDIPIYLDFLSKSLSANGFYIDQVDSYSIGFESDDYQFIVARKKSLKNSYAKKTWFNKIKTHFYYKLLS